MPPLVDSFRLAPTRQKGRWSHAIRAIDSKGRVPLPEVAGVGTTVAGRLFGGRWELERAGRRTGESLVVADPRERVLIPLGVRRELGLVDLAVVSTASSQDRIVLWAPARLDSLLEEL